MNARRVGPVALCVPGGLAAMSTVQTSICRNCMAFCPVLVTVENGRAVKVEGDPDGGPDEGYTCPKGRIMPEQHYDPARLLKSLERDVGGAFVPIDSDRAITEIAEK